MKRRTVISGLAGSITTWPLLAGGQERRKPVVGYLSTMSADADLADMGFRKGLADEGFVEGRDIVVERRYVDGDYDKLPELARSLVSLRVNVIAASSASPAARAAKSATSTIPIIFFMGANPVTLGLVGSYNRPGGNVTGINTAPDSLTAKRMELLLDLIAPSALIGELVNPRNQGSTAEVNLAKEAARTLGREIVVAGASTDAEIDAAFEQFARERVGGLLVWQEAFLGSRRDRIVALAVRHRMQAVYPGRYYIESGGMIAYATNIEVTAQQFGAYVGKVLKGATPAQLPILTPAKFDLIVNLKAASAQGVVLPPTLLARADEVIE